LEGSILMASIDTIIFVLRDKLQFYSGGQILTFALAPAVVKDIEVLDREAFKTGMIAFLDKNSITLGTTVILLSETVCFISEPIPKRQKPEAVLAAFLSTLPFENPIARILGDKIVGTNKDFHQLINEVIGQRGGRVKMVSPSFLSKETFGKKELDTDIIRFVQNNEEALIKATFSYEAALPLPKVIPVEETKKTNKRTIILVSIFFGLLGVLIIFWVLTRN
jgi:hypothetical protein